MHVCRSRARPNVGSNQLPANIPREGPWATCADYRIPTCETCGETRDPALRRRRADPIYFSFFFSKPCRDSSDPFLFFLTSIVAMIKQRTLKRYDNGELFNSPDFVLFVGKNSNEVLQTCSNRLFDRSTHWKGEKNPYELNYLLP